MLKKDKMEKKLNLALWHIPLHNKLSQFTLTSVLLLLTSIPLEANSNQKERGNLNISFRLGSNGKASEFSWGRTPAAQQYWFDAQGSNTSLRNINSIPPGSTRKNYCSARLPRYTRRTRDRWHTCNSISERELRGSKGNTDVEGQQRADASKFDFGTFKYAVQDKHFNVSLAAIIAHFVSHCRSINIKSKMFKKNGGLLLEQLLATRGPGAGDTKVFTVEELEMATEYSQGAGVSSSTKGTVYSKLSPEDSVKEMVFVKEKVLVEEGQIERFINEIITLTQMNHQNVIKLFGCCLETEAPILIYEFTSNGSLYDYIHDQKNGEDTMPHWDILMEIAAESAAGLAFLHSLSIIHGNVKSTNILMTDCLAKIAGFGPPRLIPSNESHTSTLLQRTLGYLDPEYLLTGQLTDKSDVYSFGVVLVEILTGEKPLNFDRPESQRIITSHFLLSMASQDDLLQILAPQVKGENKEQVIAVAELAKRCLKLSSAERPTMEEVARELKTLSDAYISVRVS